MRLLWPIFRPVWPALALGIVVVAVLFQAEAASAIHVWNTSTAYGHCWLVLPLAVWLLWDRRFEAAGGAPAPTLALLALPLTAAWLLADLLGIMEGRQLAAVGVLEVLLLAVLGLRLWWSLSAAFLYLVFLVPFGAFITPALQHFTASFVAHGMDVLGIPGRVTDYQIQIPEGNFYVAEACAGLRFLIASIAFGTLYAVTMFRSPWRRAAFIAISIVVPVIANGLRALGIVTLGHVLGSAQAAATDHVLYGWIFFSIVILLLAMAGMPFRQDPPPAANTPTTVTAIRTGLMGPSLRAAAAVLIVALAGPAAALWLNRPAPALDAGPVLITPDTCRLSGVHPAGPVLTETFICGTSTLTARLEILPHRVNPSRVMDAGQGQAVELLGGGDLDGGQLTLDSATPRVWLLQRDREKPRAGAAVLFIDGAAALGGLHDRIRLMRDLLTGSGTPAVALAVTVVSQDPDDPEAVLRTFLDVQGDLNARVERLTGAAT
jgi:exosortase A